ncbi:MAG TPA: glutathione peroxidase [Opitutaceae bacterium]|nr:glutathione peroxidase [Opitutaceae bacterium]
MKPILVAAAFLAAVSISRAAAPSLHDLSARDIEGRDVKLATFRGKVLLIVNVASECGYTPQYEGLQALFTQYESRGFVVLGFPCNQFGQQEPGTNAEIKSFCSSTYRVTFPLFAKIDVNGDKRHPLFALLAGKDSPFPGNIKWNFNKFLVGRDGKILKRFDADVEPESGELKQAVEAALK